MSLGKKAGAISNFFGMAALVALRIVSPIAEAEDLKIALRGGATPDFSTATDTNDTGNGSVPPTSDDVIRPKKTTLTKNTPLSKNL